MTIEAITPPSNRQGRCKVTFSDGRTWRILPSVVGDFGLFSGMELDEERMRALKAASDAADTKRRAVNIISAATVSASDLNSRLRRKGASEADAAEAVRWLTDLDLLDDRQAARQIVERGVRKGYGVRRIRQMLYEKRIPQACWDEALAHMPPMDDAMDAYIAAHLHEGADEKDKKRTVDALLRRGFTWEQIKEGLRRHSDAMADILEEE